MIRAKSTRTGADKQPQKKTIKLNSVQLLTENTAVSGFWRKPGIKNHQDLVLSLLGEM
jgi:hypothetical protein